MFEDPKYNPEVKFPMELMPEQYKPFNGDHYMADLVKSVIDKFNIQYAVETGTCLGSTTLWLADNCQQVSTVELNVEFHHYAVQRFSGMLPRRIIASLSDSGNLINGFDQWAFPFVLHSLTGGENIPVLFFLDAHWGNHCPLHAELEWIRQLRINYGIRPIIAIHDFKVPDHPEFGYDSYNGIDLSIENYGDAIRSAISDTEESEIIYNEKVTKVNRGIIIAY